MESKPNIPANCSWGMIIVMVILFFPVSFYLLYKRAMIDWKIGRAIGNFFMITGVVFFVAMISNMEDTPTPPWSAVVLMFFLCVWFIKIGLNVKRHTQRCQTYLNSIYHQGVFSINALGRAAKAKPELVKKDIQGMIDSEALKDLYIDNFQDQIKFMEVAQSNGRSQDKAGQHRVVVCPACGASNEVTGAVGECQYCGTPLQ